MRLKHAVTGVIVHVADGKSVPGFFPFDGAADPVEPAGTEAAQAADYESLKVPELRATIEKRNEDRDEADKLSTEGLKADLIAILTAADAEAAGTDN